MVLPPGRTIMVAKGEEDYEVVDLLLVTSLERRTNGSRKWKARQ